MILMTLRNKWTGTFVLESNRVCEEERKDGNKFTTRWKHEKGGRQSTQTYTVWRKRRENRKCVLFKKYRLLNIKRGSTLELYRGSIEILVVTT